MPYTKTRLACAAVLAIGAGSAVGATATFEFTYLAQATTTKTAQPGASIYDLSPTAQPLGSISFTDLSDLGLGDGKDGVRVTLTLNTLGQLSSGNGFIYTDSLFLNFPSTGPSGGMDYITTANSYRYVSGSYVLTTGADGGIEWSEFGSVGAVGLRWTPWQQQINIARPGATNVAGGGPAAGTYDGSTIVFDLLNGEIQSGGPADGTPYTGFSVASLLANPVANQAGLPSAYAWLRVRSRDGGISTSSWFSDYLGSTTSAGVTTQTLQVLAPVPEPSTYTLVLAGIGLLGFAASRRKQQLLCV